LRLTPREELLLIAIAEAKSNKQIAYEQDLSIATVKVYVSRLIAKMRVDNRVGLAKLGQCRACRAGAPLDRLKKQLQEDKLTIAQARELLILVLGSKGCPETSRLPKAA
jgi:DNA-binding CsgD family transcriptional regulator